MGGFELKVSAWGLNLCLEAFGGCIAIYVEMGGYKQEIWQLSESHYLVSGIGLN